MPAGHRNNTKWPIEHDNALKRLRNEGYSSSQIAGLLWTDFRATYSRNAVIGRLHRLGLTEKKAPRKFVAKTVKGFGIQHRKYAPKKAAPEFKPEQLSVLCCVEVIPRQIGLVDLEPGECRYPYGDGPFTFCGHATLRDHSYCGPHFALTIGAGTASERQAGKVAA